MANVAGSLWVEGTELHWLADDLSEGSAEGTDIGTPANAVLGSIWLESNVLHYIDASGDERTCDMTKVAGELPADGHIVGSLWYDTADGMVQLVGDDNYKHEVGCGCDPSPPTFSTAASASGSGDCPMGRTVTISWTLSATPAWAALEVWRCTTSGCSDFAFWKRLAIGTTSTTETFLDGPTGGGASTTYYRTYKVRVVPACSANGAGPFCRDSTTSEWTETLYACVV